MRVVCVCPPVGLGGSIVLRIEGHRAEWPEVYLVADTQDWLTGEPLRAGWRVYGDGDVHISVHTLKWLVTGNRAGSSHTGMGGNLPR